MIIAVIAARGGSKSLPGKNLALVNDKPLLSYPIRAAMRSKTVDRIFVSTNDPDIARCAREHDAFVIHRPDDLCTDEAGLPDVARHAYEYVCKCEMSRVEAIVLLMGNTVMTTAQHIDRCVAALRDDPHADSALSVAETRTAHPLRAYQTDGPYLHATAPTPLSPNRQDYAPVFYHDGGPFVLRPRVFAMPPTPGSFSCLGARCVPVARPWFFERDIHSAEEIALAEWWLSRKEPI